MRGWYDFKQKSPAYNSYQAGNQTNNNTGGPGNFFEFTIPQ